MNGDREARAGVVYALAAFLAWGANPIYFKAVAEVSIYEVLAHRVIWAVSLLALWFTLRGGWRRVRDAYRSSRTLKVLLLTTAIITCNWLIYIWAIGAERVLESSLGYYINPLVNVLLGVVVLGERLTRRQAVAVGLAAVGVANLAIGAEGFPWVALSLAGTFGMYGLLRKTAPVDSPVGLFVETSILLPFALGFLIWQMAHGTSSFLGVGLHMDLLLVAAGPVTALPLLWFTHAARRLRYATVGLFQYIAPSCQFLLAVLVFDEPFTTAHLITFACIWTALALYTSELFRPRSAAQEA